MGTTYSPRTTDAEVEAAFSNKKETIDPAIQAILDKFAREAEENRDIAMTKVLEDFLENREYNGHNPTEVILEVNGTTEKVPLLVLHETLRLVRLVFVNSESLGRTYGALTPNNTFEPMTLIEIG